MERFWSKVDKTPGHGPNGDCWLWTAGLFDDGYGVFQIEGAARRAHRLAWEFTHGSLPSFTNMKDGIVIRHKCHTPRCCNPDHLEPGTTADNVRDRDLAGRTWEGPIGDKHWSVAHPEKVVRGMQQPNAKLTDDNIREIRRRYAAGGVSQSELGREFGVEQPHISLIVNRKIWKHVD